jgi:hypothetical protein
VGLDPRLDMAAKISRVRVVTIRLGMDWIIRFIDTLYTQLGTTGNYSAIAVLHILQLTAASTSVFSLLQSPLSVSWQQILAREL